MTTKLHASIAASFAVTSAAMLISCSSVDGPAAPELSGAPELVDGASYGLVVSDPLSVQSMAGARAGGTADAAGKYQHVAYVSLAPGRFSDQEAAIITNLRSGASRTESLVGAGGLDPVPIPAAVGDTIEVAITSGGTVHIRLARVVLARMPPIIVRTHPEKGKVHVALNVAPITVFSEPMDGQSLTPETIELRLDGEPVDASITLSGDGLRATLAPHEPLMPRTIYTLVITTGVMDGSGDPLQGQVEVAFTTLRGVLPGRIAFGRFTVPLQRNEIWAVNADGSNPVNLADGGGPAWSPDGTQIAFSRDHNIYVMNADGRGAVRITDAGAPPYAGGPAWSPDGSRIAFTYGSGSGPTLESDVYVMNTDGSGQVNLTNDPAFDGRPAWSPDGSKIAFGSMRDGEMDIYVMNADGSNVVRLTDFDFGVWNPAWSPDGSRIAFEAWPTEDNGDIYVMNADGTGAVNLTNDPALDRWPAWSPDGTAIVFSSGRRVSVPGDPPYDLYVMNDDGSEVERITTSETLDWHADWR